MAHSKLWIQLVQSPTNQLLYRFVIILIFRLIWFLRLFIVIMTSMSWYYFAFPMLF